MTVGGSGAMNRMGMQMGGMGMGRGQGGGNGMKDVMQQLSPDQRSELKAQMQTLSESDRQAAIESMKEVDSSTLSSEEYYQTLLSIVGGDSTQTTTDTSALDTYA